MNVPLKHHQKTAAMTIPKPELRAFGGYSDTKPPVGVTWSDVKHLICWFKGR